MTHDERVTRLAERMAKELERSRWERTDGKLGLRTGSVLRPYAAAMVQAEEALESAEGELGNWDALKHDHDDGHNYGDCPRCSWDNAHAETVAALAALRALEAK